MQPRTHAKVGEMVINGCTMSFQSTPAIARVATVSQNIKALPRKMYVPIWGAWVEQVHRKKKPIMNPWSFRKPQSVSWQLRDMMKVLSKRKTSYVTLVLVTHPACIEIQRREKKTFNDAGCFKTGFLFQRRFHHAIERTWQSVSMQPDGYLKLSLVASPWLTIPFDFHASSQISTPDWRNGTRGRVKRLVFQPAAPPLKACSTESIPRQSITKC